MVSTSYDGKLKVWNTHDWVSVRTLSDKDTKLSSASISRDTKYIITTSFDRTLKLWQKQVKENEKEVVDNTPNKEVLDISQKQEGMDAEMNVN